MISAGDFRNGITIEYDNNVYQIIEFQHVKPGKGAAFVRTKLKNIKSGGVVEKTFRPTEKCPQARIDRKDMQYLYNDGDLYNFMDTENYEQIALDSATIGDALKFVKENEMCKVCSQRVLRGASFVCGAEDHRDGARLQGRHRYRGVQACHCRDRGTGFRSAVCGAGRCDQD